MKRLTIHDTPNAIARGWHSLDCAAAWAHENINSRGGAFNKGFPHCPSGVGSDAFLIALAVIECPHFEALCRMSAEELEALRGVAENLSSVWIYATAAFAWQELPPNKHPTNAPKKLP